MTDLFRIVLPLLILVYFLIKGIKSPLYFLGIPFLMFMRESIFFYNIKLFFIPGKILLILGFVWIVLLWVFFSIIRIYKKPKKIYNTLHLNVLDYTIIGLVIITVIGLGSTIINNSILTGVFKEFINLISLFAGFFIIRNWTSYYEPEELENFLFSLLIVNTISSSLFLLHQGLQFTIYLGQEYLTEVFDGQEITRTMWFMPQLPFFSVAFCLINLKKKPYIFTILLIVNLLATFITYFRSFSIILVGVFILYSILVGLKKGQLGLVVRNIVLYALSGALFFLVISKIFPANTNYIIERFSEITNPQKANGPNNLEVRFLMSKNVINNIDDNKKILGMGSVTEYQTLWTILMKQSLADIVWTGVIFRWGYIGLVLFVLLYLFSLFKAFTLYMKSDGTTSDLALLILLYLFSQIIQSFIDWTFMSEHGFTTGLWYFAILSVLLCSRKDQESKVGINTN